MTCFQQFSAEASYFELILRVGIMFEKYRLSKKIPNENYNALKVMDM